jgi:hypothetical protein
MDTEPATKTCGMCCMQIPGQARKCPYCQHFQHRLAMVIFHPGVVLLVAAIPMLIIFFAFAAIFDQGEDFQGYAGQIEISESELAFGDTPSGATVAVMGTITNTSPVPWRQIQFHVDFADAEGRRVDVGQNEEYSFYLPARAATAFKVSFRREFPEEHYVKHSVRVLAARDARARW